MNTTIASLTLSLCTSPVLPNAAALFATHLTRFTVPASPFAFSAAHSSFSHFLAPVLRLNTYTQQAFSSSPPTLASVFSDCTFTAIAGNCIYVKDSSYVLTVERCGFRANTPATSCIFFIEGSSVSVSSACFDACEGVHPGYAICSHDHDIHYCTVNNTNEVASNGQSSSFAGGLLYFSFYYNNVTATISETNRAGFCLTRSAVADHHCKYNACLNNSGTEVFTIYHPGAFLIECFAFVGNTPSQSLVRVSTYAPQLTMGRCVFRDTIAATVFNYPVAFEDAHPTMTFVECSFDYPQFALEDGVTVGSGCVFGTVGSIVAYPTFNPSVCYALGSPVATNAFTTSSQLLTFHCCHLIWLMLPQ